MKVLATKKEAWELVMRQLEGDTLVSEDRKDRHYGKLEIAELLDFVYDKERKEV